MSPHASMLKAHMHPQVLWHTAAAFSERLAQAAGLPAENLNEQTAELAADRVWRQQAVIPAPAQIKAVEGVIAFPHCCAALDKLS